LEEDKESAPGTGEQGEEEAESEEAGEGEGEGGEDALQESAGASAFSAHRAKMEQAQEAWKELARQVEVALNANLVKAQGLDPGSLASTLQHITRENESYTTFLRRFSTIQEEIKLDADEFDYIYYTLGMDYYGNIPLIEPLEYKEIPAIREFVIVLDTSGSCSEGLIRRFLTKTYDILCEEQLFGTTLHVHIIQCDAAVQSDVLITSQTDLEEYAKSVTVLGRGGTDFRPAFSYVDKLLEEEKLSRLDGLLYFTDGYGTYPTTPRDYPTAFLFSEVVEDLPVPAWAMRVYIEGMQDFE
ncbi:MAG: metallopeptidase, partial [Blautia sp.]|nr:metallopeptidase [Blautia sp.]